MCAPALPHSYCHSPIYFGGASGQVLRQTSGGCSQHVCHVAAASVWRGEGRAKRPCGSFKFIINKLPHPAYSRQPEAARTASWHLPHASCFLPLATCPFMARLSLSLSRSRFLPPSSCYFILISSLLYGANIKSSELLSRFIDIIWMGRHLV